MVVSNNALGEAFAWVHPYGWARSCICNRDGNGQSNSDGSSGSNPAGDLESNEDGDSDRNEPRSRDGNG